MNVNENEWEAALPFFQIVELKIYFHQLIKEERLSKARSPLPNGGGIRHDIDIGNENDADNTNDDGQ